VEVFCKLSNGVGVVTDRACGEVAQPEILQMRVFGTMTCDLLGLADWLNELGITHAAMEATGVYWKPVWNVLEGRISEILLVNAQHVKMVPGRKTDQKTRSGWPTCCGMACCAEVLFLLRRYESFAI
jgi:hypothetical protein